MTDKKVARIEKLMSKDLGVKISNYEEYWDGFSFTVKAELNAYKAAYKYAYRKRVIVLEAPHIKSWTVQIFGK